MAKKRTGSESGGERDGASGKRTRRAASDSSKPSNAKSKATRQRSANAKAKSTGKVKAKSQEAATPAKRATKKKTPSLKATAKVRAGKSSAKAKSTKKTQASGGRASTTKRGEARVAAASAEQARAVVDHVGDALFGRVDDMLQTALSLVIERFESNEKAMFAQMAQLELRVDASMEGVRRSVETWLGEEDPKNLVLRLEHLRQQLETLDEQFEMPQATLAQMHDGLNRIERSQTQLSDRMDRLYGVLNELTGDVERLRSHVQAVTAPVPRP